MRIELDYEEIKDALAKAIEEKTQSVLGKVDPDNCYFEVSNSHGEQVNVGKISFGVDL